MTSGLYEELVDKGLLIPHEEISDVTSPDPEKCYKIIKPEMVPFVSYPYEWSFSQLQDAALATLAVQQACLNHGIVLKDCSAYNIQFHKGKPVFIDTLSFEEWEEGTPWTPYRQFCQHFLSPLALMSRVDVRLGKLLTLFVDGIPLDLASRLLPYCSRCNFSLLLHLHLHAKSQGRYSDIYFIIVDAYTRSDVLKDEFGIDNSDFVRYLERNGFYVPKKSACNYVRTDISKPCALNMDYLQNIERDSRMNIGAPMGRFCALRWPRIVRILRNAGYLIVTKPASFQGLEPFDPDVTMPRNYLSRTEFDNILMGSTVLRVLPYSSGPAWRERVRRGLDFAETIPDLKSPKFALVHTTSPHPPFCFQADGSAPDSILSEAQTAKLSKREYAKLYGGAIAYTNDRLKHIIRAILSKSKVKPIIIITGDHGAVCPFRTARAKIFSAYYLPGGGARRLYPSITPVNAFRIVLDQYLGGNYPLLPDHTYMHRDKAGTYSFYRVEPESFTLDMSKGHK